jgi:protein TonB
VKPEVDSPAPPILRAAATASAAPVAKPTQTVVPPEPQPVEPTPVEQPAVVQTAVEQPPVERPPVKQTPVEPLAVVVAPAVVLERVDPDYSRKAMKGIDEPIEIILRVQIDERGRIARVLVDQGIPGSQLEAAAVSAVLRWKFQPATENGVPTRSWTTVRFPIEP